MGAMTGGGWGSRSEADGGWWVDDLVMVDGDTWRCMMMIMNDGR